MRVLVEAVSVQSEGSCMKSIVSIITGLMVGWVLCNLTDLTPDVLVDPIGSFVASSHGLYELLNFFQLSSQRIEFVHVWVIFISIITIPVLVVSFLSLAVYVWSRKARLIVYSSLVAPICMSLLSVYFTNRMVLVDSRLARSFWNISQDNIHTYFVAVALFIMMFLLFTKVTKLKDEAA